MITQPESGLTQPDYTIAQTEQFAPKYQLELHRWSFAFEAENTRTDVATAIGNDFDAVVHGTKIIWVTDPGKLCIFNGTTWAESVIGSYPTSVGKLSLVTDGDDLYLYVMTTTGIQLCKSTDDGATWGSWATVRSITGDGSTEYLNSLNLAAVEPGVVFWTALNTSTRATELHYSVIDTGDNLTEGLTDIKLVTSPRSMSAIELDSGGHLVVMSIDTPGETSAKFVDNKTVKYIMRAGGVIGFQVNNGTISDHMDVDLLERMANWRYRENPRLSRMGDKVFMLAAGGDGTKQYPFSRYRYYTTKDGWHWSAGFILPAISCNGSSGLKFLELGDEVFILNRRNAWVSEAVMLNDNSTVTYNVTSRLVSYEAQQGDMHQASLVLSDEDDFFSGSEFTDPQNTWAVVVKWGYDGMTNLQTVALLEVDTYEYSEAVSTDGHQKVVRLTARDRLAWMTDLVQSEQPHYWQAQLIGADSYTDRTATGYGGMQHTATQSGMFRTEEETLLLTSNNDEGVAFSTFKADWNGAIEEGLRLSQASNNEYAGVCFRGRDKDNLWYAAYFQSTDTIKLVQRKSGTDQVVATSSTLSWTTDILTEYRFIRARFRYAVIHVDTSTDGITWTNRISYVMRGQQIIVGESAPIIDRPLERGFCGVIGKGYSTLDEWEPDIDYIDEGAWLDFDDDDDEIPIETYPVDDYIADFLIMTNGGGVVKIFELDYDLSSATVTDAGTASGIGTVKSIIFDPFDYNRVIALGGDGIAVNEDVWNTTTWDAKTATIDGADPYEYGSPNEMIHGSRRRKGYFCWSSNAWFYYTTDYFETVHRVSVGSHINSIAVGPFNTPSRGEIWVATGGEEGDIPGLYRSLDWGKTWSRAIFTGVTPDNGQVIPTKWLYVHIPTTTQEGLPKTTHKDISGVFEWADGSDPIDRYWYSYSLHKSPFVQKLTEDTETSDLYGTRFYTFPVQNGKAFVGNPAEGRVLNTLVSRWYDDIVSVVYRVIHVGFTDKNDDTYHTLVTEFVAPSTTGPEAITGGDIGGGNHKNAFAQQIIGSPVNPDWFAVIGSQQTRDSSEVVASTAGALIMTDDGWATSTDWSSVIPSAYLPVSILADVRQVTAEIEETWEFDTTYTEDEDWLDDELGGGDWDLDPEYCINFIRNRVNDRGFSQTVEDSFRAFGGFAGIHDFKFESRFDASVTEDAGWTPMSSGSMDYTSPTLTFTPGTSGLRGAVHGTELPHNYLITCDMASTANHGFFVNLRSADLTAFEQTHYYVGFDSSRQLQVKKWDVVDEEYDLMRLECVVSPTAGYVEVGVREISFGSDRENLWLSISVWVDHALQMTFTEWIKTPPDTGYYFGLGTESGDIEVDNLRVPQLTDFVEWNSIDPGETVMGGLQRAIEGRYTRMAMRFDGALHAWRETSVSSSHTFTLDDMEGQITKVLDRRSRVTHVRMVGAYQEAEYLEDDMGVHKFIEMKNPYLMSPAECYLEARMAFLRQEQAGRTFVFSTSYRPLLEVGDRIVVPDGDYTIMGYDVKFSPAQAQVTFRGGKYIGG